MASLGEENSPIPRRDDDAREGDLAPDLEVPYTTGEEHENSNQHCPWRTLEFHNQECYRYFDCPSHLIERILSVDEQYGVEVPGLSQEEIGLEESPVRRSTSEVAMPDQEYATPELSSAHRRRPHNRLSADAMVGSSNPSPGPSTALEADDTRVLSHFDSTALPIRTSSLPIRTLIPSRSVDPRQTEPPGGLWDQDAEYSEQGIIASVANAELSGSTSSRISLQGQDSAVYPTEETGTTSGRSNRPPEVARSESEHSEPTEIVLPRWQPDAEVTYCPICQTQFSIFVRKHHCRKCGRVVCNSCSPHRIIIPHQFIVRPPGSEVPLPENLLLDGLGAGFIDMNGLSGGERVRLCNPCVPDPNVAPPQSSSSPSPLSPRSTRHRSRSSLGGGYPPPSPVNRYGGVFTTGQSNDPYQFYTSRTRTINLDPSGQRAGSASSSSRRRSSAAHEAALNRFLAVGPSSLSSSTLHHHGRRRIAVEPGTSSRQRALSPPRQIAEDDECPICHHELPSRNYPNFESLREAHITSCIQSHSTYGSPRTGLEETGAIPPAPRRTGMYTYPATEKDCVDDAECTICLEEFTVGIPMARLECLCRFHRSCIAAWFVNHPGRCPVHQHDGFGF